MDNPFPTTRDLEAVLAKIPQLLAARSAWVRDDSGAPVLVTEFHGPRVDDIRAIKSELRERLREAGLPDRVELIREGWLPEDVSDEAAASKYRRLIGQRKKTAIEDGSFAVLPEDEKDSFAYFGSHSKIRTPVELTYPGHITVGNWVSFGRYGKIVMLPEQVFADSSDRYVAQHYPELAGTFDYSTAGAGRKANLYLGDGTTLGDRYFIICTQSVEFGKHVMTAANLFVSDCHHLYENTEIPPVLLPPSTGRPIRIEDHVWIGINCSILEGVTIGRHAVVAANSVVKEDVPPYTLVAGTPAKVKKEFRPQDGKDSLRSVLG